jgi:hypothetical protein
MQVGLQKFMVIVSIGEWKAVNKFYFFKICTLKSTYKINYFKNMHVFWDIATCSLRADQCFRGSMHL